ncbi:MAG: glycosyltransferase, partial [Candidatus Melainabacteria bacterium]
MDGLDKHYKQKLLVINFGGIGDEILFLPTLKTLKEECPHWHLTLLLEPRASSVSQLTDLVDEIITFDIKKRPLLVFDLLALLGLLRDGNYQTVISSGSSPAVAILLFLSGIGKRIGYDSGALSRLLLTASVRLNKNQYAADMYHDLIQGLGLT